MPAGIKLAVFAVLAVVLSLCGSTAVGLLASSVLAVCCYAVAGLGVGELLRQVYATRWMTAVMLTTQLLFLPPVAAAANTGRVLIVIVFAALFTLTTPVRTLLDSAERALSPVRALGANPTAIGLMLALTLNAIPVVAGLARNVRDAQRARGVRIGPHTAAMPLLVMSLKHADEVGEALAARGLE